MTTNTIVLLLAVIFTVFSQSCSPSAALDQMSTGTYIFQLTTTTQRKLCYTISSPFLNPQLVAGVSTTGAPQNQPNGIDFSLRYGLTAGQAMFTLYTNNQTWQTVRISYLFTTRKDFILGSYLSPASSLSSCTNTSTALTIPLPSSPSLPASPSVAVLTYLNGLRTSSPSLSLQFMQPQYDSTLKQLNLTAVTNGTHPIQLIFFSYLLADMSSLTATGYSYQFSISAINADYVIAGVVSVVGGIANIQTGYLGLNRVYRLQCVGCSGCQSGSSCAAIGGTVNGARCVKCTNNMVYNGNSCVCANGLFMINGVCTICPTNTVYNPSTQTCTYQPQCPPNSQLSSSNQCLCITPYYNISGICSTCPPSTTYNSNTQICTSIPLSCANNQIPLNGICVCITGYTKINNVCVQVTASCGDNKYLSNGTCRCLPSLLEYQGGCYHCPNNSAVTADQSGCRCNSGYSLNSYTYNCQRIVGTVASATSTGASSGTTASGTTGTSSGTSSGNTGTSGSSGTSTTGSSTGTTETTGTMGSSSSGNSESGSSTTNGSGSSASTNGGSTSTQSGTGSTTTNNGGSIYLPSNTITTTPSTTTTPTSTPCPINTTLLSNGICRTLASITSKQQVLFLNAVYINIIVDNVPVEITGANCAACSTLIQASLVNAPAGVTVQLNYITNNPLQYVATIAYQTSLTPVTVQLQFNPTANLTLTQLAIRTTILVQPSQLQAISIAGQSGTTNSKSSEEEVLDGVPSAVLNKLK